MNWVVRIADDAQAFIDGLPAKGRRQVSHSISQLEEDPFRGDVKPLHGKAWRGYYRKRAGDYPIIFFVHQTERLVDVGWVVMSSEKTYRQVHEPDASSAETHVASIVSQGAPHDDRRAHAAV
jgi:mRNA-degrading endonuclease RelE of RelBE toxin-antitoxin system